MIPGIESDVLANRLDDEAKEVLFRAAVECERGNQTCPRPRRNGCVCWC